MIASFVSSAAWRRLADVRGLVIDRAGVLIRTPTLFSSKCATWPMRNVPLGRCVIPVRTCNVLGAFSRCRAGGFPISRQPGILRLEPGVGVGVLCIDSVQHPHTLHRTNTIGVKG